jgi:hypothetical protein
MPEETDHRPIFSFRSKRLVNRLPEVVGGHGLVEAEREVVKQHFSEIYKQGSRRFVIAVTDQNA